MLREIRRQLRRQLQHLRRLPNPAAAIKRQSGVALLIALFAMTLMTFIAVEVSYDTSVDYVVAAQQVNRLRAYYAAKSGIEISLLRLMLYKQVMSTVGASLGPNKSMLDPIWNFPFMWPPTLAGTGKATEVDKDILKEAVDESLMQGVSYATTITPEGGKIDINDLGSDIEALKKAMIQRVLKIFQSEMEHNEDFKRKYSNVRFEEVVNNIADYIDEDKESLNGGDETAGYRDLEDHDIQMPPNRPLRTLDELHQVALMKDDFYNLLKDKVTVFGTKGININYSNKEILMTIDPSMTNEAVDKIIARRNDMKLGGPFKDNKDLFGYIQPYGVDVKAIEDSKIPLLYDMEFNFRVTSTGLSANVKREITAVVYDYQNLTPRFAQMLEEQWKKNHPDPGNVGNQTTSGAAPAAGNQQQQQGAGQNQQIQFTKGRPTVVYWEEN